MYQYYCKKCGWERSELMDKKDYSCHCPNCKYGYADVYEVYREDEQDCRKIAAIITKKKEEQK